MLIFVGLSILAVLFLLSAFWSGSETALTSLSKYRVKKLIAVNKSLSGPLSQWLKSPYYLLTTVLVVSTVNDLVLSYLATILSLLLLTPLLLPREIAEIVTWLGVTFMLLVFGDITPKVYSRRNPEKVTLLALPVLSRITRVLSVVIAPFTKLVRILFPRAELVPVGRLSYVSLEEIRGLILEANTTGALGKDTSRMLEGVLRLGRLNVSQIMTPAARIEAVNLDQPQEKFLDLIVETGRSRVPVYHGSFDRIVGFIHTKDLLKCWKGKKECIAPPESIIRPPYFISPDKKVSELLREFQSGKTHLAFVRDAFGTFAGLVTLEDVLEDIVGEILDEYDLKKHA